MMHTAWKKGKQSGMKRGPYMRSGHNLKYLSLLVIFAMLVSLVPTGGCNGGGASSQPEGLRGAEAQEASREEAQPSPQAQAAGDLKELATHLEALSQDPARAASELEEVRAGVEDALVRIEDSFTETAGRLAELDLPSKEELFRRTTAEIEEGITGIRERASSLDAADPATFAGLAEALGSLTASPPPPVLGTEPSRICEPEEPAPPVIGTSIAPAYLAGTPGLEPSSLPTEPGEGDLAETEDAPHTEEIVSLAAELEGDPVLIYEWVSNNIDFEPYYGSKKGAAHTLAERAGNATDTASLLLALLRASGVPARYVTGVVEITSEQASSWLAVDSTEQALKALGAAGIPAQGILSGGVLSKIQLTQTYAEAYVPYTSYRGAGAGEGPSAWLPLDASFKAYEVYTPPVDIIPALGGEEAISDEYLSSVREKSLSEFIYEKAAEYIGATDPQLSPGDLRRSVAISQKSPGLLPSLLPYGLVSATSEERELDPSIRWRAEVSLAGPDLSLETTYMELAGGAFAVSFSPATEEDELLVSSYSDPSQIPAYLLSLTAEIKVGEDAAESSPSDLGGQSSWSFTITTPSRTYEVSNSCIWGAPFSVAFSGTPSPVGGEIVSPVGEDFPQGIFSQAAMSYVSSVEEEDRKLSSLYGLALIPGEAEAAVGLTLLPSMLSGVPVSVDPTGIYMDADLSTSTPVGADNQRKADFLLSSGLSGSYAEHSTLQQSFSVEAISTAKVFQLASQQQIPTLTLDASNWATESENLSLPSHVIGAMGNDINAGYTIKTPVQELTYLDWTGVGWMVIDPLTGEGSYMISGFLSGGETVQECGVVLGWHWFRKIDWVCISEIKAYDPEFPDPEAAGKGEVLANGSFSSQITGTPDGGFNYTKDPQTKGSFIMGATIVFEYTAQMKFEGSDQVNEYKSKYTLPTYRDYFDCGGWYYSVIDLSTVKAAYDPYEENQENNPRIDFKLLPLLVEVPQFTDLEEGKICVTTVDKFYRPIFEVEQEGGGRLPLDPEWKVESGDSSQLHIIEERVEHALPPVGFPPFIFQVVPSYRNVFTVYPFYTLNIEFEESAAGRFLISANEPNCTSRQYIYGEGWKDDYADYPNYQHKAFFECIIEESLFFAEHGTTNVKDWDTGLCSPAEATDILLKDYVHEGEPIPEAITIQFRVRDAEPITSRPDYNSATGIPDWISMELTFEGVDQENDIALYRKYLDYNNQQMRQILPPATEADEDDPATFQEIEDIPEAAALDYINDPYWCAGSCFCIQSVGGWQRETPWHYLRGCAEVNSSEESLMAKSTDIDYYPPPILRAACGVNVLEISLDGNGYQDRLLCQNPPDWLYIEGYHERYNDTNMEQWKRDSIYYNENEKVYIHELVDNAKRAHLDFLVLAVSYGLNFNDDGYSIPLDDIISTEGWKFANSDIELILGYRNKAPELCEVDNEMYNNFNTISNFFMACLDPTDPQMFPVTYEFPKGYLFAWLEFHGSLPWGGPDIIEGNPPEPMKARMAAIYKNREDGYLQFWRYVYNRFTQQYETACTNLRTLYPWE